MTKELLERLPAELCELLDGSDLAAKAGETFSFLTEGEDGWPNVALLGVGEVLARSPRELAIALWSGTASTESACRTGRATLSLVAAGAAWNVRLDVRLRRRGERLVFLDCPVRSVERDVVQYAVLESGPRFRLVDPAAAIERWRQTLVELRRV